MEGFIGSVVAIVMSLGYTEMKMRKHQKEYNELVERVDVMEQKNGIQNTLLSNGIVFKIDEQQGGLPEIISEQTFIDLLQMQDEDTLPSDIMDTGWEDEDLNDDDLQFL